MEENTLKQSTIICISLLVGMVLEILPLPHWAVWYRPEWVFVILLFWMVSMPNRVGMVVAFIVGITVDLLTGTLLGQHALAYVIVAYFVAKFHLQLRNFPFWQQLGMMFILILLELALQYWVMGLVGLPPKNWGYWFSSLTSIVIWPWFCVLLSLYPSQTIFENF